jgi:hypothetical protein
MATTPNYGFYLLTDADPQDAAVLDSNFSLIDTAILGAHKGAWPTFVPNLTASGGGVALGTSPTQTGKYIQRDKDVQGSADIAFGTGSPAAGTGTYIITLPVAANAALSVGQCIGTGYIVDVSANDLRIIVIKIATATTANMFINGTASPVGAAAPWTWATTDQIHYTFCYEAA